MCINCTRHRELKNIYPSNKIKRPNAHVRGDRLMQAPNGARAPRADVCQRVAWAEVSQQQSNVIPTYSSAASTQQACMAHSLAEMHPAEDIPVYVMLPLDTVNAEGVFRYAYVPWFSQALQVLTLSGVHGVAVDVWWCAVERSPRQYNWTGYRQLFEMVRGAGLKLQVVLSFHACGGNVGDMAHVPLPGWVMEAGQYDPDIFFTDRPRESGLGQRNKEYLSIWADECPVLPGGPGGGRRTPLQAYGEFMAAFKDVFHEQLGSLIEEVVVGTGPCGELRYPSYVEANGWRFPGVGEFQCYDRRALASLAAAAAAVGRPEWGYAGPHDSGGYNSSPSDTGFFAPGGSWDSDYGNFFLNWYSSCLLEHGEKLLQLANQVFGPYKTPKQPPQGPLAQAQAVIRRLQSMLGGGSSSSGGSSTDEPGSSSTSLVAVAAAATVAAAAAAAGGVDGDAGAVAAAAMQAKGLLHHVHQLQQQHQQHVAAAAGRISISGSDDDVGSSFTLSPSNGSTGACPISASTSTTCLLTPQGSIGPQQHDGSSSSSSVVPAAAHAAVGAAASSIWDQLGTPQAQALATNILQQLQRGSDTSSSLALMAAGPGSSCSSSGSPLPAAAAAAAVGVAGEGPAAGAAASQHPTAAVAAVTATAAGALTGNSIPTISSVSSSSVLDLDLQGLLSASQQHLASLCISSDGSRGSELSSSSPRQQAVPAMAVATSVGPGSSNGLLTYAASSSDVSMAAAPAAAAMAALVQRSNSGSSGAATVAAAGGAAGVAAAAASLGVTRGSSSSTMMTSLSGGSLSGLAAMAAAGAEGNASMECSTTSNTPDSSSGSEPLAAMPAAAAAAPAVGPTGSALLQTFLEALSGLGLDGNGSSKHGQQQQPQQPRRRKQQQQLVVTLKIAGVHWWYNSTSHASELTAGYYNTDSRDGYRPILALCEKYSVNLTLTCVEMCDAQHPSYALCGPEGLLRQIRAMAAKQQVTLSGENALPIFTPGGVDAVALERVVSNVRACRAAPLRSCSSWPGPATTSSSSGSTAGPFYSAHSDGNEGGGSFYGAVGSGAAGYSQYQQQYGGLHRGYNTTGGGGGYHGGYQHLGTDGHSFYHQQQQQHHAYHHHYGAGMGAGSNILSTGRTFSELGTLLSCDSISAAAQSSAAASGNGMWQQQQQQGCDTPCTPGGKGSAGARTPAANGSGKAAAGATGGTSGEVQVLPAMRAFTFLRLGPEILQPECHASWMRFMHRMLNERA